MNPLLVATGIFLSAKVLAFIADELTEEDRQKEHSINEQITRILKQPINNPSTSEIVDDSRFAAKHKELLVFFKTQIEEQKREKKELIEEISQDRKKANDLINSREEYLTPLRKTSIELLIRQLSEAICKCHAYSFYLDTYYNYLKTQSVNDTIRPFSLKLPVDYPYSGKIIYIDNTNRQNSSWHIKTGVGELQLRINDINPKSMPQQDQIPVMITHFGGRTKSICCYGSHERGLFKANELQSPHLGFTAIVKEIKNDHVILTYADSLNLFLPRRNLINPNRFPPLRSSLTVFPVKWNFELKEFQSKHKTTIYPVTVSERQRDAVGSLHFNNFPICFDEKDFYEFLKYYQSEIMTDNREFIIGVANKSEPPVMKRGEELKLQYGDVPLLILTVEESVDNTSDLHYYLKFARLCKDNGDKPFSPDDIYIPFDATITPFIYGTPINTVKQFGNIDNFEDITSFLYEIFEEFKTQHSILTNRKGLKYFLEWENITNQLIEYLEQKTYLTVNVSWIDQRNPNSIYARVMNHSDLRDAILEYSTEIEQTLHIKWKPQFFVKDQSNNRYTVSLFENGTILNIVGSNIKSVFLQCPSSLTIYLLLKPYAEIQQQHALSQFRRGQVVNPVIQAFCFDTSLMHASSDKNRTISGYFNKDLLNNSSQREAVERAFSEKNMYIIQGPPGTGKTTVIKELVEQTLISDNFARVLIVSQANVAVDNALSGLVSNHSSDIVRCGNGHKVSPQLQQLRVDYRCEEYLESLKSRQSMFSESFYNQWLKIIKDVNGKYSPALYELSIRSHRIVGATCIGLSKQNIGLERTEFDLVIIDEAGKALPAEVLIPIIRAKKIIIIGDHNQLPPVINPTLYDSETIDLEDRPIVEKELFRKSFFERIITNAPAESITMLDTQYRMPSVIGSCISTLFYNGQLKNGEGTDQKNPIFFKSNLTLINYDNCKEYKESKYLNSVSNKKEANDVVELLRCIRSQNIDCSIAVITPYKGQKALISKQLMNCGVQYKLMGITVDTIDAFQGSEADIVIFCSTRGIVPTSFYTDSRRINVALSRAKKELIIIGRLSYFYRFKHMDSCLPELAQYILKYGSVIPYYQCINQAYPQSLKNTRYEMIPLTSINIRKNILSFNPDRAQIEEKINEYYKNGEFISPITIRRHKGVNILIKGYEQFLACVEMNIEECWCELSE